MEAIALNGVGKTPLGSGTQRDLPVTPAKVVRTHRTGAIQDDPPSPTHHDGPLRVGREVEGRGSTCTAATGTRSRSRTSG